MSRHYVHVEIKPPDKPEDEVTITLSRTGAGALMTALMQGADWADYPVGQDVYDCLAAQGIAEVQ